MADDLKQQIRDAASGPASVTSGQRSATAQRIPDLIEADKYLSGKEVAAVSPFNALKRVKAIPPSALGS
jgi:hypothetical protein